MFQVFVRTRPHAEAELEDGACHVGQEGRGRRRRREAELLPQRLGAGRGRGPGLGPPQQARDVRDEPHGGGGAARRHQVQVHVPQVPAEVSVQVPGEDVLRGLQGVARHHHDSIT